MASPERAMLAEVLGDLAVEVRSHRANLPFDSEDRRFFLGCKAAAEAVRHPQTCDARPSDWLDHESHAFRNGYLATSAKVAGIVSGTRVPSDWLRQCRRDGPDDGCAPSDGQGLRHQPLEHPSEGTRGSHTMLQSGLFRDADWQHATIGSHRALDLLTLILLQQADHEFHESERALHATSAVPEPRGEAGREARRCSGAAGDRPLRMR